MIYSTEILKKYLLGNLPEIEMDEIEQQIISAEISEESLLSAENDLVEDYLENSLSSEELVFFQKNFLVSKERNDQISQIYLLKRYAENKSASRNKENRASDKKRGFFRNLLLSSSFFPARAVLALIIVGVFVWLFAFVFLKKSSNDNFSALEQAYAEINREDLSEIGKFKNLSNINLVSGNFRSADNTNKLSKQNLTEKVLVRLALPDGVNSEKGFGVEFLNDGKSVFTQTIDSTYQNPHGSEIRLFVPSEILNKGVYEINVKNAAAGNSIFKYGFSVN